MLSQISIPVANVAQLIELGFTNIEIWKSEDLANTWAPLTGRASTSAVVLSSQAKTAWAIGGSFLRLSIDGDSKSVYFSDSVKYWTPQMVVGAVNAVVPNLASLDASAVRLTHEMTGRAHYIEIENSPPGVFEERFRAYGLDLDPELVPDQLLYSYVDLAGAVSSDFYRWRFSAAGLSPVSAFSNKVRATKVAMNPERVSIGYMSFVGMDGEPVRGQIIVSMSGQPIMGSIVTSSPLSAVVEAGDDGFLQIPLLRGATLTIAIEGTSYVRTITVPSTPSFNLATTLGAATDGFTVQHVAPLLTRRSL